MATLLTNLLSTELIFMAKTLKFNLKIDKDIQVRTLEDLRNNFVLEDILEYYKNKKLHKWLRVRGFEKELMGVDKITSTSEKEILIKLIEIFGVETDPVKIDYSLEILKYDQQRVLVKKEKEKMVSATNTLVSKYFERYDELIEDIINNPENRPLIQAAIETIEKEYQELFKHDFRNFFYRVKDESVLAVIYLLINPFTRQFYIKDEGPLSLNNDTPTLYSEVKRCLIPSVLNHCDAVIKEKIQTGQRWVELTCRSCLVLELTHATYTECAVAQRNDTKNFLDHKAVSGKYPLMNGLQFQNSDATGTNTLYYIEI